jgi:hypothetical protein
MRMSVRNEESTRTTRVGVYEYSDRFRGTVRLAIVPRAHSDKEAIQINLKVFSREDVIWLSKRLQPWERRH